MLAQNRGLRFVLGIRHWADSGVGNETNQLEHHDSNGSSIVDKFSDSEYLMNNDAAQEFTDNTKPKARSPFKIVGTVVIAILIIWYLGRSIWTQWDAIAAHPWQLDWVWLIVSGAMAWLAFAVLVGLWRLLLLASADRSLSYSTAYKISAVANFGKYVPGKIWSVMGIV